MPHPTKGRIQHFTPTTFFSRIGRRLSAAKRGALWHLPAFLFACSPLPEQDLPALSSPARKVQIYLTQTGKTALQGLDLFFFQDDSLGRLDAYQHFGAVSGDRVEGVSSTRARTVAALSNCPEDIYAWSDIRTFSSLTERVFRLKDENPEQPLLCGITELPEGARRTCRMTLRPMLSRIRVRSVACDFTGRPYAEQKLENVRAYLTYVRDEYRPFAPEDNPSSWLNAGHLDEAGTEALPHPEMVLQPVSEALGGRIYPDIDFYCYPNPVGDEAFGQPVTRLVIEGRLLGSTCYYPIELPGLEADVLYRMDITLTRAGTSDPDIPAASGTVVLESHILDWDERESDDIHFR